MDYWLIDFGTGCLYGFWICFFIAFFGIDEEK